MINDVRKRLLTYSWCTRNARKFVQENKSCFCYS